MISAIVSKFPPALLTEVKATYDKPIRAYHSWKHVLAILRYLDEIPFWNHPKEVALAAIFHDAVYVAGHNDNEKLSAELAMEMIAIYMPHENINRNYVSELIELTAFHGKHLADTLDKDKQHFLDADMAILGANHNEFDHYDEAIRVEYSHIPTALFNKKRKAFFVDLLSAPRIYLSDHFYEKYEIRARENLKKTVE